MVVGNRYKYIRYDAAGNEARLRDMQNDPHEKTHCTTDPDRAADLAKMKQAFDYWFPAEKGGTEKRSRRQKQKTKR